MRHGVAFVAFLLLSAAVTGGAAAQESPELEGPSATTFDVYLEANGDARWVVRTEYALDTAEERDAFRAYAESFENGEVQAAPGIQFFRAAAAGASEFSGREMRVINVSRASSLGTDTGTLKLSFRWTAFLGEDGDRYVLRDAFRTAEGTWLQSLESGQELWVHTPPNYEIVRSIEARQENDSLIITGPESFDPEEFVVAYEQTSPRTQSETPAPEQNWGVIAAGLLGLLLAALVIVALWRRRATGPMLAADAGDEAPPPEDGDAAAAASAAEEESDGVDPELLSDEERVEYLLDQHGGRMRQADIVAETDWSDAKVSQLLSRMAEAGRIEKLRLGRENVISMPDGDDEGR